MPVPTYRVLVYDMAGANFAKGNLIAEFENAKNVGWADYLNDVPEGFFTVNQDDRKLAALRPHKDNAHILIYRDDDLVHAGMMGEWQANARDVIIYSYGYLAALYLLLTDWALSYTNAQIGTIVSDAWTRAKTTLSSSLVGWCSTGTVQSPVTTSGGATPIVLPTYKAFYKRILFLLREMAALGRGNTTNNVVFEITPSGVFNFWKDKGVDRPIIWRYGDGVVRDFDEDMATIYRRNDLMAVGANPNNVLLRQEESDPADILARGRRMDTVYFSWVRDSTEMGRALDFRFSLAKRDSTDTTIHFYANKLIPAGATGAQFALADSVHVKVDRGLTNLDGLFQVVGQQVFWVQGQERVRAIVQEVPGS